MNRYSKKDKLENKLNINKRHLIFAISLGILLIISLIPYNMIFTEADTSSDMIQGMNLDLQNTVDLGNNETIDVSDESQKEINDATVNTVTNIVTNNVSNEVKNETVNEINNTVKSTDKNIENIVTNTVNNNVTNTVTNTVKKDVVDNKLENTVTKDSVIENTVSLNKVTLNTPVTIEEPIPLAETTLTATLWDTSQYAGGTGTALTETGVEITGWEKETSKYLQIDPGVPADGNSYSVSVILPEEFYIVGTEIALPAGYKNVEFTKNEDIVINDTTKIELNKYSGTAKYTLNDMGVSGTIQVEMGYDVRLWDKQSGSSITANNVYPIVVILTKTEANGTETEVKRVCVSKVTAGTGSVNAMSMSAKIEGESQVTSTPTVPKDKKVTIFHGINDNEGKSRYKYYPLAKMEITLPYYTDSVGTKHYIPVDLSSITLGNIESTSYTVDSSLLETSGKIIINIVNGYWNTGNIFSIVCGPLTDELLALDVNDYRFQGGKL